MKILRRNSCTLLAILFFVVFARSNIQNFEISIEKRLETKLPFFYLLLAKSVTIAFLHGDHLSFEAEDSFVE